MRGPVRRSLAAILVLSLIGCGTPAPRSGGYGNDTVREAYRVPAWAKVGLASGLDPTVTETAPGSVPAVIEGDPDPAPSASSKDNVASLTADVCFSPQGLVVLPLCLVTFPIIFGALSSAAAVRDGIKATVGTRSELEVDPAVREKMDRERIEKATTDLKAAERDVNKPISYGTDKKQSEQVARAVMEFEQRFSSLAPLVERVQRQAQEAGFRELVMAVDDAEMQNASEQGQSRGKLDYVFEFAPVELQAFQTQYTGVPSSNVSSPHSYNTYWFRLNARGRLVRMSDKVIVSEFEQSMNTGNRVIDPAKPESLQGLSAEFDSTLNLLARKFVAEWIRPTAQEPWEKFTENDI